MLRDYSLIDASGLRRTSALVLTCPAKDLALMYAASAPAVRGPPDTRLLLTSGQRDGAISGPSLHALSMPPLAMTAPKSPESFACGCLHRSLSRHTFQRVGEQVRA